MRDIINYMGLFNTVNLKIGCPNCGVKVEWQTKDLILDGVYVIENTLETFELTKRISGVVYTGCDKCSYWSEVIIKNGKIGKIKTKKPTN